MENHDRIKFHCEMIVKEFQLVGQSVTANFPNHFPDAAIQIQRQFSERKHEIINAKHPNVMFSPYMCNNIVATYFACLEVDDLSSIPDGMIGFKLPVTHYAKISCTNKCIGEAYSKLFAWMGEQGLKQKFLNQSFPMEIFYLDEKVEDQHDEEYVELLIPIYA